MKKKIIAVVLCIIMCTIGLSACGSPDLAGSRYIGTWVGSTVEYNNMVFNVSEMFPDGFSLILSDSGKITLTVSGEETTGKWNETEKGIVIDEGSDNELIIEDKDGELVMDYSGLSIHFVLQPSGEESDSGELSASEPVPEDLSSAEPSSDGQASSEQAQGEAASGEAAA